MVNFIGTSNKTQYPKMQKRLFYTFIIIVTTIAALSATAQTDAELRQWQFMSYGKIPTWTGVAADWQKNTPVIHLYNNDQYKGHATFVMNKLKQQINFKQFKALVSDPQKRQYIPFFLYDLRAFPLKENEKIYDWALMVEDYQFTDTDEQIAQLLLRLANLIPRKVAFEHNGIILLANNPTNKINMRLNKWFKNTSYLCMTVADLQQKTNSRKAQILNEGEAIGTLVWVENDQIAQQLRPNDIAVYNYIPLEVPPVAGIITLFPQTPLSHTAILAKNRGTPNIYIPSLRNIKAESLVGKQVKFIARKEKISLTRTHNTLPNNARRNVVPLTLPVAKSSLGNVVIAFDKTDPSLLTIENIGTKAANYARLQRLLGKIAVREGYAIGFQPYFSVIEQQTQVFIEQLYCDKDKLSSTEIRTALSNIRTCIEESEIPPTTLNSLRQLLDQHFKNKKIRLRSSTNCEDLPNFNGAGLYESKGINAKEKNKKLSKKLLQVYASLWNEAAFLEREYFGIDHRTAAMAIQINEAFDDPNELGNGVIVTKKDANNHTQIWINAQCGDVLVTNPTDKGETSESFFLNQQGKITQIETESSLGNLFLNDGALHSLLPYLAQLSLMTEQHFVDNPKGYGVDIEFKIMNENGYPHLYFKQARLLRQKP